MSRAELLDLDELILCPCELYDELGMRDLPPLLEDPGNPGWLLARELRSRRRAWARSTLRDTMYEAIDRFARTCRFCGAGSVLHGGNAGLEVDHIVPLARGGTNTRANLRVLCMPCNDYKGAMFDQELLRQVMRLTMSCCVG